MLFRSQKAAESNRKKAAQPETADNLTAKLVTIQSLTAKPAKPSAGKRNKARKR